MTEHIKDLKLYKIYIQQPEWEKVPRITAFDLEYSDNDVVRDHVVALDNKYNKLYSMYLNFPYVKELKPLFEELNSVYKEKDIYWLNEFLKSNFWYNININFEDYN